MFHRALLHPVGFSRSACVVCWIQALAEACCICRMLLWKVVEARGHLSRTQREFSWWSVMPAKSVCLSSCSENTHHFLIKSPYSSSFVTVYGKTTLQAVVAAITHETHRLVFFFLSVKNVFFLPFLLSFFLSHQTSEIVFSSPVLLHLTYTWMMEAHPTSKGIHSMESDSTAAFKLETFPLTPTVHLCFWSSVNTLKRIFSESREERWHHATANLYE